MSKWLNTIQKRLTITIGTCFITLIMSIAAYLMYENISKTIPFQENLTRQLVQSQADQITSWVQQRFGEMDALAHQIYYEKMSEQQSLDMLSNYLKHKEGIYESFGIVDVEGQVTLTSGHNFSITHRPYYNKIEETGGTVLMSQFLHSNSNQEHIVTILYRLPASIQTDGKQLEYLSAAVSISKLRELANELRVYGETGQLLDKNGVNEVEEEVLKKEWKGSSQEVVFTVPIQETPGWKLHFTVEKQRLYGGMYKMLQGIIWIGIVIGIILVLLLISLSTSIVKPLRILKSDMKRTGEGERNVQSTVVMREDEIGQLGRGFQDMLTKLYHMEHEKRKLELQMLQEQIKPHFVYNTLDTIQWTAAEYGADEVVDLVQALATYFRIGLGKGDEFVSLQHELEHVESYLLIQRVRYKRIAAVTVEYDEQLLDLMLPRFTLQPLVENSIYHGIKPTKQTADIRISAYYKDGIAVIEVANNGVLLKQDRMNSINHALASASGRTNETGFGLYSVNRRIEVAFGSEYGLRVEERDGWFCNQVTIPLKKGEAEDAK
ncbi:histidine kinase [Paenibacillus faecalis]|uniref:histidine kinase n=1 Tax=Paenibacillus faecalis TaxID=2079532 RepID=UPI000D110E6D|nr:histidine kinase [Paenibacillus faecalis]